MDDGNSLWRALLAFPHSASAAAADLGGWDRSALECAFGTPGVPRKVGN